MTKAKKAKKSAKPKSEEVYAAITVALTNELRGIREELRGIREELQRFGATNTQLEAATGRLGRRIGEFIEHQFHSVK